MMRTLIKGEKVEEKEGNKTPGGICVEGSIRSSGDRQEGEGRKPYLFSDH